MTMCRWEVVPDVTKGQGTTLFRLKQVLTVSIQMYVCPLNCLNVPSFETTRAALCHVHVSYLHGYYVHVSYLHGYYVHVSYLHGYYVHVSYLHGYYVKCETQMCINFPAGLLAGETHYTYHSAWQKELYSDAAMNCGMYGEWAEV